jgi:hypothetical protein
VSHKLKVALLGLSTSFLAACSTLGGGAPNQLSAAAAPDRPATISQGTSGSACGIELFDFAKFGIWDRTERAYHAALTNAGAKALLAPQVSDSRIDLMVATVKCAEVSGTAIY